ncbi:hypothetical protein SAMN04487773_0913 [Enterobacter sp. kpr-6]|uniref:hypothetical protein n=1 Tax=Enterobacter sp. kpr-6 TaxID=1761782 RepID=UPI0008E0251A|nr:hypothetical protein [Enterobacter sp. kpr-6]SFQ99077.1 hypothetical protein SAMN04487773_0913 [Enterobacter sp. kpr-6]
MSSNFPFEVALPSDEDEEAIERAELLFKHFKERYDMALASVRRLEDKASKIFGSMSTFLAVMLLIIRYWWPDLFGEGVTPLKVIIWGTLSLFMASCIIAWGFVFSAMQLKEFDRPSIDFKALCAFYLQKPRYNTLSLYAKEYGALTESIESIHQEKASLIRKSCESILYAGWLFVIFIISVTILKVC